MISESKRVYLVCLLLVFFSWFLADLFEEEVVLQQPVTVSNSPSFFSHGYKKKETNQDGKLKNLLKADKMLHYQHDGTTHLSRPRMTLFKPDAPAWYVESDQGILQPGGDHLFLEGNVWIRRPAEKNLRPIEIQAKELNVTLSQNYAETDKWAEIIDKSNRTQGVGLELTYSEPVKIYFKSKVKGRYEFK